MTFNQLKESVEIFSKYVEDDDIKVYDGQLEINCGDVEFIAIPKAFEIYEKQLKEVWGWN